MVLLDKRKALYVKCCIIPNGVTDSQGDTLYAEDIKKIFTSFNNQDNFEIYHNGIPLKEVSLLENYISTANETIGTAVVPSGSWNAVVRVDNPDIQNGLLTREFGGVSLNNRIAPRCKGNLKGTIRYKDVLDAECVIPLLISFVEGGANGYGLHVMDYDAYILKSKDIEFNDENGGRIMDFKEFINGLKSLIKEAEDTPEEEPAIEKEDKAEEEVVETSTEETAEEETTTEEPADETDTSADDADNESEEEDEPAIEKEETEVTEPVEEASAETEDAEILKEDDESDFEAKVTAIVEKILAEKSDQEEKPVEEKPVEEDEDTPKITKSKKVIIEDQNQIQQTTYFEMTGRDPMTGKKIRK